MNALTAKLAYIVPASIAMVCAIVAAYLRVYLLALGLIVLSSALLMGGSVLVANKLKKEQLKK